MSLYLRLTFVKNFEIFAKVYIESLQYALFFTNYIVVLYESASNINFYRLVVCYRCKCPQNSEQLFNVYKLHESDPYPNISSLSHLQAYIYIVF